MLTYKTENENRTRPSASVNNSKRLNGKTSIIQTKLNIGKSNDSYEQEADRVADKVVNQPPNTGPALQKMEDEEIQRLPISKIQRQPEEEIQAKSLKTIQRAEDEELQAKPNQLVQREAKEELQMKSGNGDQTASQEVSTQIEHSKGGGSPLPTPVRSQMESGIGADFSGVRIHTGSQAENLSQQLNAQAFTVGNDVFFNKGKYNPESQNGKHLLAHELTHTVQQGAAQGLVKSGTPSINSKPQIQREITFEGDKPIGYEFTMGEDLSISFLQLAHSKIKDDRLSTEDLMELSEWADKNHGTTNELMRLFMAGLDDQANLTMFKAKRLESGNTFEFPFSSITDTRLDRIRNLNKPDEKALEKERNQDPRVEEAYINKGALGVPKKLNHLVEEQIVTLCGIKNASKTMAIIEFAKAKPLNINEMLTAVINGASDKNPDDHRAAAMAYAMAHIEDYGLKANLINGSMKVDGLPKSTFIKIFDPRSRAG